MDLYRDALPEKWWKWPTVHLLTQVVVGSLLCFVFNLYEQSSPNTAYGQLGGFLAVGATVTWVSGSLSVASVYVPLIWRRYMSWSSWRLSRAMLVGLFSTLGAASLVINTYTVYTDLFSAKTDPQDGIAIGMIIVIQLPFTVFLALVESHLFDRWAEKAQTEEKASNS